MESAARTNKQRKFLLILPLLVIPFLTMGFWALGGGKGGWSEKAIAKKPQGLNLDLPSANIKEEPDPSKMSFYEKAKQEEEKSLEAMKNDPYFDLNAKDSNSLETFVANAPTTYKPGNTYPRLNTSPIHSEGYVDPNEARIMKKLNQLQSAMNKPQQENTTEEITSPYTIDPETNADIDRLEEMMYTMKDKTGEDSEMQRLDGMLDKIMDIQHPERVIEKIKEKSIDKKGNVFPVIRSSNTSSISLLGFNDSIRYKSVLPGNGFFGLQDDNQSAMENNAIEAVVHDMQTLVTGSVTKIRLLNDIYINGVLIPSGHFLFGLANLDGERLKIDVNSIRYGRSVFPVQLSVHDLDGLDGIYIPGAISRDVAKQAMDNSVQSLELGTLNPSIGAQAAASGINAAKSLLSKKVRLTKVAVKAGYKILLLNKQQ